MTTLAAGEIAIIGYNSEGSDDGFSFVLLTDVDASTEIKFTDNEWRSGAFDPNEGAVSWTSGTALSAGTVVRLQFNNSAETQSASVGTVVRGADSGTFNALMSLSTSGDHILAYQGAATSPSFLTAFIYRPAGYVAGNTSETELPPGLTIGVNAINFIDRSIPDEFDNGFYNGPTSGSAAFLSTAINTESNWVGDNDAIPFNSSPGSFTVGGPATPAEIRVSQVATEIVDGDLTPSTEDGTNLGAIDVASGTITQTFTISNTGGTVLNIGSVTISGANAADFVITSPPPATVAPSSSATFNVTFDPSAAGLREAIVIVNSDDSDEAVYDFAVQGTGALPTTGTTLAAGDVAFVGYNSVGDEFAFALLTNVVAGTVIKFTDAGWTGTQFRNADAATGTPAEGAVEWVAPRDYLAGEVVTYRTDTEEGRANFQATSENGFFLSASGFGPSSGGDQITAYQGTASASLATYTNIASIHYDGNVFDAGATSSSESALPTGLTDGVNALSFGADASTDFNSGVWTRSPAADADALRALINNEANWVGTDVTGGQFIDTSRIIFGTPEPEIVVQGLGTTILDGAVSPNDLDGTSITPIEIDDGAQQQTYTILNQGNVTLNVGSVQITGADAADFSVVSGSGTAISPGTSANLVIAFDPTTAGLKNATVTINSDDTDEAAFDFAINAVAQAPNGGTDLSAGSIAFTGFNSISPDQFTFVLLEDVVTGTSIKFTDAGWTGSTFRQEENALEWTALNDLSAGTVVFIDYTTVANTPNVQFVNDGYFNGSTSLNSAGDQITAYQGTASAAGTEITNLAAVHFNASEFNSVGPIGTGDSLVPTGLTDGVNAVSLGTGTSGSGTEFESGVYSGPVGNTFAELRAAIANEANWTTSSTSQTLPTATLAPNQAPTVSLITVTASLAEDADTSSPTKVADVVVTDDGQGTNVLSLSGVDAALFQLVGTELFLRAGVALDFEVDAQFDVTVNVDDATLGGGAIEDSAPFTLSITDVNEAPTLALNNVTTTLAENVDTASAVKVADITVTDDALGTNDLSLTGADASLFEIVANEVLLRAGGSLDFETNPQLDLTVILDDAAIPGTEGSQPISITVTDVNEAPSVALDNTTTRLPENTDTAARIKVADIVITDDATGTNVLSLSGDDALLFETSGTELFLRDGVMLNAVANEMLDVTVQVDDASVGGPVDGSAPLTIVVVNTVQPGTNGADSLVGTEFADDLSGGGGNDTLEGRDGEDTLDGGADDDILLGEGGFDQLFGGDGFDQISGGTENDIANGGADNDIISAGSGNDLVFAQDGNDLVFGQSGNDDMFGGTGNDKIFGGLGNDVINLGDGNDQAFGGGGADRITGAGGNDVLSGGGAVDTFVFRSNQGDDRITDFTEADFIDISAFAVTDGMVSDQDWRDATSSVVTSGGGLDVTISWDGGGTVTLQNVGIASLTDADFVF